MNSSEKEFYREKLLTLSGTSSDEYVKGIYDQWADNYDKVLDHTIQIFHDNKTYSRVHTALLN